MVTSDLKYKDKVIAIDFDGTCVAHEYPIVGRDVGAAPVLKRLVAEGAKLILWTIRSKSRLADAVAWFGQRKIPLFGININPHQLEWSSSPKVYAHIYIDDAALGTPLTRSIAGERPYVDWTKVEEILFPATKENDEHKN